MALQIKSDVENRLLRRREIRCLFPQAAGHMTRIDAVKALSQALKVESEAVHLISLLNRAGTRDVEGLFYFYLKPEDAKKHLPQYVFTRLLSKEERKKIAESMRKVAKGAKPSTAEKKKS